MTNSLKGSMTVYGINVWHGENSYLIDEGECREGSMKDGAASNMYWEMKWD